MQVEIRKSPIHGRGVFAVQDIQPGTPVSFLCWWHPYEQWWRVNENSLAPYFNHSFDNNCIPVLNEEIGQYIVITSAFVPANTELTLNYNSHPEGIRKASDYDPPLA